LKQSLIEADNGLLNGELEMLIHSYQKLSLQGRRQVQNFIKYAVVEYPKTPDGGDK